MTYKLDSTLTTELLEHIDLCQLLLGTDQLRIIQILIGVNRIGLEVESFATQASCPACHQMSANPHSAYFRFPTDLAWADHKIVLHLKVKRFFCRNQACPKRTFAEQFLDLVSPYARRTDRVLERQRQISLQVCALSAELLLNLCQLGISDTTVNRLLRALPELPARAVRVLGLDDWAKCKGQSYGTVLVDLEESRIIDLLSDRAAETVTAWLREKEGIEFVARDRSRTYAEAITAGAPHAVQIADRWHLLKNLSESVLKLFQGNYTLIKEQLKPGKDAKPEIQVSAPDQGNGVATLTPAEERRKERMDQAQQLRQSGWTHKDIAARLNLNRKTVRRYLRSPHPKSGRSGQHRLIDPYRSYLITRWNAGNRNATQLFLEIHAQGYQGKTTTVRNFVKPFRQDQGPVQDPDRPPTLREITWYVLRKPVDRKTEHEATLDQIKHGQPQLETTIHLARSFAAIIREKDASELKGWLKQADDSGIPVWRNFANSLKQDEAAVCAALMHPWSNGPTEGHINRLKFIKRMMYGRGKLDLLRKRVLWQGRWGFT